ncbi:MAG: D-glycero-D-manno-heptose 1,7-bisphosphate phosphatase [Cellvibrionaceae bacterium]|jgi:D-glycero-D-manno-heptose 1,7-bisphosphate phosphatase
MTKVAFLDRDGVINQDRGYVHKIKDFQFTHDCIEGLRVLKNWNYQLIIVTNQSGIGRGYYSEADYQYLTRWYRDRLKRQGVDILDILHCPHTPEVECLCRKPQPGLFMQAQEKYPHLDMVSALMFGDKLSDLEAANRAGVKRLYLISNDPTLTIEAMEDSGGKVSPVKIIRGLSELQHIDPETI